MKQLIDRIAIKHEANKEDLVSLLNCKDKDINDYLYKVADKVRHDFVGDEVHLRGLIEFSNICKNNCLYCGIRLDNKKAERYRYSVEDILRAAKQAKDLEYKTIVLQSGEDAWFTLDKMKEIIRGIKDMDMALTLSIGEKSYDEYKAYRDFGADRYLLRIETTDKDLYHRLDPNMTWDNRKRCLDDLKLLGYEVGSGTMVGLPDQSIESIADDILFFKNMDIDMCGIGPFIPHPDTPLRDAIGKQFDLSLKVMALTRLVLSDINIPATTAMEALNPNGRIIALQAGANVVMPNVSDMNTRKLYQLYPGKVGINEQAENSRKIVVEKILSIGRSIGTTKGKSLHKKD
ncbi:MAG: [FeFe] hydrogenase H-cluster radical SAM maturase HydE [Alphaproteobacteria bacterium]|nr:[FeFe] hydrogenase H-cluster radical SAM maturase HydE [Alphaproteobacteria bacterium]